MSHLDSRVLAYVGGVMDGEGCISIRRTKARPAAGLSTRYSVSVTVGNTSGELIAYLVGVFEAGCVVYRYGSPRKRACYLWCLSSRPARIVLDALLPYLLVKRPQALLVLEFINGFDSHKGGRRGAFGATRLGQAELARRAALYAEVRKLNRVGNPTQLGFSPNGKKSIGVTSQFRPLTGKALPDFDRLDSVTDLDAQHRLHA
jgi:hypothetical protein